MTRLKDSNVKVSRYKKIERFCLLEILMWHFKALALTIPLLLTKLISFQKVGQTLRSRSQGKIVLVLSFILNSTTVIGKIKEMPQSLFYHIQCYITMDYNKWYTSLLLTNVKKSMHLKFKIMSITCSFHVSDVVLTFYISYKHVRNQI